MNMRYENLSKQIQRRQPKSILEIGVYDGQHSYEMIKIAQRYSGQNISYYGFDLFEDIKPEDIKREHSKSKIFRMFDIQNKLAKTNARSIKLYKGYTKDTLKEFVDDPRYATFIDFIFVDGGHSVETIKNDWFYVQKLMNKESVVIFDDYYVDYDKLGCKNLIDNLDRDLFYVEFLQPIDVFQKEDFIQKTQMIKVQLKPDIL